MCNYCTPGNEGTLRCEGSWPNQHWVWDGATAYELVSQLQKACIFVPGKDNGGQASNCCDSCSHTA
jgi:hypothetical protein